ANAGAGGVGVCPRLAHDPAHLLGGKLGAASGTDEVAVRYAVAGAAPRAQDEVADELAGPAPRRPRLLHDEGEAHALEDDHAGRGHPGPEAAVRDAAGERGELGLLRGDAGDADAAGHPAILEDRDAARVHRAGVRVEE